MPTKKYLIIFLICLIGTILFVLLIAFLKTRPAGLGSYLSPTAAPQVVSVFPDVGEPFIGGSVQKFTLGFKNQMTLSHLVISLTQQPIDANTTPAVVPITPSIDKTQRIVTITLPSPIDADQRYKLTVLDKVTQQLVFSRQYISTEPNPAPVSNNPALQQYLPYTTTTFTLSYLASRNLYVFDFTYNPSNADPLQTQFANAKAAALAFIKSKNIDPNTLTIDWRYY